MVKKQKPTKETSQREYTPEEFYEGYYWLILHVDPHHDEFIFKSKWKSPLPDCIKTLIEKHRYRVEPDPIFNKVQKDIPLEILNDPEKLANYEPEYVDLPPTHPLYSKPYDTVDMDNIFTSLLSNEDVPRLQVENRDIEYIKDLVKLWEVTGRPDLVTIDYVNYDYSTHFHELEHYLEPQHKRNLKLFNKSQPWQGEEKAKETMPRWKKAKAFFTRHWQWLIAAIIIPIVAPIIAWIVIKKWGS